MKLLPNRNSGRTHKVFITFLFSYVLVLIVTLIIGSIVYINAAKIIREQEKDARISALNQLSANVEKQFEEISTMALSAATSQGVHSFLSVRNKESMTEDQRYMVFNVTKALQSYRNSNKFIADMFIYFLNSDLIISTSSMNSPDFFYKNVYSYDDIDYDFWHLNILPGKGEDYIPELNTRSAGMPSRMLTVTQKIPITENNSPSAVLFMLISEANLNSLIGDISDGGAVYVIDKSGRIVFDSGDERLVHLITDEWLNDAENTFHAKYGDGKYVASSTSSYHLGWHYIYITPESAYTQKLSSIQLISIIVLAAAILLVLLLAVILAYTNYTPIKQIIEQLDKKAKRSDGHFRNEFEFIKSSIDKVYSENDRLATSYEDVCQQTKVLVENFNENMNSLKNSFICDLIRGRISDSEALKNLCVCYELSFPHDGFVVVLFQIDKNVGANSYSSDDEGVSDFASLRYLIVSSLEEQLSFLITCNMAEMEDGVIALLINQRTPRYEGDLMLDLKLASIKVQSVIYAYSKISITVGIGSVHIGIIGIDVSYKQARKALDYKIIRGRGQVITYDEIANVESNADQYYFFSSSKELQLLNHLKAGEIDKCEEILRQSFKTQQSVNMDINYAKQLLFNQICIALKVLNETGIKYLDIPNIGANPVDLLLGSESLDDIFDNVLLLFGAICEYFENNRISYKDRQKNQLLLYIEENYCNPELSQTSIADHFGITPQYLSKFFKQSVGQNMTEYINWRRIEKAKHLLAEDGRSISEISEIVGFGVVRTLDRVFKRYEGVSPGKYRDSAHGGQDETH